MIKDSREEPKLMGEINFSESILNEDKMGEIKLGKGLDTCQVYVYSNEDPIPHFHLFNKNKTFESCICIYEPLYFNHGFKTDKLNNKQCEILNKWLDEPSYANPKLTNWELIDTVWVTGNSDLYIKKNNIKRVKPFYTNMVNMRG